MPEVRKKSLKIDAALFERLSKLSESAKVSLGKLADYAVEEYLAKRTRKAEGNLEATLEDLRANRRADPDFDKSIAKFIEAERGSKTDPAEGTVYLEEGADPEPAGPTRTALRKALNG
jgi:hypothetical protein